jgi:PilZ domain
MRRREAGAERKSPRVPIELPGSLSGRAPRPVTVVDLSTRGCLVRCAARLDPGAILDLGLKLDSHYLTTKVRVTEAYLDGTANDASYMAGLEFLSLPARDEIRLRQFLDEEGRRRRSAHASPQ